MYPWPATTTPNPRPAGTQLYSTTYNGGYKYFEDSNWTGAWMLRASGEIMESGDFSPELAYNVYRFEESRPPTSQHGQISPKQ